MNRLLSRLGRGLIYMPKTIYLNLKILPLGSAIKFPCIIMGSCSLQGVSRKAITIDAPIKRGMIRIGAQKSSKRGIHVNRKTYLMAEKGGTIIFKGKASIGAGTSLCASGGKIILGDKFSCNVNCFIYSMAEIAVGDDVLMGWNINIRDNDGHPLYEADGRHINANRGICLGDHVWIASYVDILKGVHLPTGTIVGTHSLVTHSFAQPKCVIAGIPAKVIRKDITWEHRCDGDD